jgi:excisionase family DNA binding protein
MEPNPVFLSTAQAAELLGVHRTTVLRLVDEGLLEARVYRYGERPTIRIPEAAVADFLRRWSDQPVPGEPAR